MAVVGQYYSTQLIIFDLDGNVAALLNKNTTFGSNYGGFVVKYSANGSVIWAARMDGSGDDIGNCAAFDNQGNLAVVGEYFSPQILIYDLYGNVATSLNKNTSNPGLNFAIFVVKYS